MLTRLGDYYREALDGQIVLTKFLDLEEIKEINSLNKDGLKVYLYGGYEEAERVRAIVQLAYYEAPLPADFKIAIYKTEYNANYQTIGHRTRNCFTKSPTQLSVYAKAFRRLFSKRL